MERRAKGAIDFRYATTIPDARVALLLGYTTVALDDIDRGVERLTRAYRAVAPAP